ncbi:M10 family metallopeptidase C-terminal domain-containing protein [Jannaschia rubra]|uniref:M10 family metallopeptidase C-terminal domain-containing protein n=1 Tax=Jannaschia rubra TaxID=282197 RepID=UPI00248FF178|nr:M10 family metallopeptidase C-terminal domain-containing protein [Jannaschia rubra]
MPDTHNHAGDDRLSAPGGPLGLDGIADYLRTGTDPARQFDTGPDDEIGVDLTALTRDGHRLAREALESWTDVTGIDFVETRGDAQIAFDDDEAGAFASWSTRGGEITGAEVNVGTDTLARYGTDVDGQGYRLYVHEIGHALGLGHGGPYDGAADYPRDAAYANDSWQASVMSYFSQTANTFVDASFGYTTTPMPADVIAVQDMYGAATDTRTGDTTYGFGDTTGEARLDFTRFDNPVALTLVDSGGRDTLNLTGYSDDQVIDLNPLTYSDVGGGRGNLSIARGTAIENALGGSGDDVLVGNGGDNTLTGGAGDDTFVFARGGFGNDVVTDFETGADRLAFDGGVALDDLAAEDTEGGALLTANDDGASILLAGLSVADLTAAANDGLFA